MAQAKSKTAGVEIWTEHYRVVGSVHIPLRREPPRGGNVNLHPSTWEALRVRAFEERTTISEQVRRAVAEYLGRQPRRREKKGGA
jgi:hypothetical protein